MGLNSFFDEKDLKEAETEKVEKLKEKFKSEGKNEYEVERKIEEFTCLPEKLEDFESGNTKSSNTVLFYFGDDEFEKFKNVFKVLDYIENNANQNWIIMGFLKLVEENKIIVDEKERKVRIW